MELTFLTVLPMKSSQNVIAKLWDFSCTFRPFYFLTQSLSLHILDMWHEKGRSYGRGAVWCEASLGTKTRLQYQAVSRKSSNSETSECCGASRAPGVRCNQLVSPSAVPVPGPWNGPGNVSVVRCLQHETWQIFSSCEMLLLHTSEINLASTTVCIYLFIYSFMHLLTLTSVESELDISFSSEEFKWELLSVPPFPPFK